MSLESVAQGKDAQAAAADALERLGGAPHDPSRALQPRRAKLQAALEASKLVVGKSYTCRGKPHETQFQLFCEAQQVKLPSTWHTVCSCYACVFRSP